MIILMMTREVLNLNNDITSSIVQQPTATLTNNDIRRIVKNEKLVILYKILTQKKWLIIKLLKANCMKSEGSAITTS